MAWVREHRVLSTILIVLALIILLYLFSYVVFNTGDSITPNG